MEIDIDIEEYKEQLDRMLLENPEMEKKVQKLIGAALEKARKRISQGAQNMLKDDPREAYKAVKRTVYKRILGGSVSILQSRRAGAMKLVEPERTLRPGQRGGNRRQRSARTEQVMSYQGKDRGFILRFVNSGTAERQTRYGARGSIGGQMGWFESMGRKELDAAAEEIAAEILKAE